MWFLFYVYFFRFMNCDFTLNKNDVANESNQKTTEKKIYYIIKILLNKKNQFYNKT